jgi:hypothetical protein
MKGLEAIRASNPIWLRGVDLNHRPLGYDRLNEWLVFVSQQLRFM